MVIDTVMGFPVLQDSQCLIEEKGIFGFSLGVFLL